MKLIDRTVNEFLAELGSSAPVPGGGSAAALAGALGAALLLMTCRLPKTRNNTPEEKLELERQAARLGAVLTSLREAVDEDSESFTVVMEAMRLPRGSEEQKRARSEAIQNSYRKAAEVPLAVCSHASEALLIGSSIVGAVNPNALSDAGTGAALLGAALDGASFNVSINLGAIQDEAFVTEAKARLESERRAAMTSRDDIMAFLSQAGLGLE